MNQVDVLADYDFNLYNIKTLQIQMTQNLISGIEECIINLFDERHMNIVTFQKQDVIRIIIMVGAQTKHILLIKK